MFRREERTADFVTAICEPDADIERPVAYRENSYSFFLFPGFSLLTLAAFLEPHADALIDTAVKAGARLVRAAQDHFYGERSGTIRDPFGYDWLIGHAIEDVDPAEMQRRYTQMLAG